MPGPYRFPAEGQPGVLLNSSSVIAPGDSVAERRLLEEALALAQSVDDTHDIAECTPNLGWQALRRGDGATARSVLHGSRSGG